MSRILQPLLRINHSYRQISFEEALQYIYEKCSTATENKTLLMTSGDYTNEELYLMQRLCRAGFQSNALGSFDYYRRGTAFFIDKNDIVPFVELLGSSHFFCILDHSAETASMCSIRKLLENCKNIPRYDFNTTGNLHISNYGDFFRAVNHYLIRNNLAKGIYVDALGKDYGTYKNNILSEDFSPLLESNQLTENDISHFAEMLLRESTPVFIVWERLLDERGTIELENLCMLLDIQAKPSSGFLNIKADLNSQGLFDMGIFPDVCVGGLPFTEDSRNLMNELYGKEACTKPIRIAEGIEQHVFTHLFVMNATGCPIPEEIAKSVEYTSFSMLQTADWDGKDHGFDLLMPASLPEEASGTFTDSTRAAHNSKPDTPCPLPYNNLQQFSTLGERFGLGKLDQSTDIFLEYASFFQGGCRSKYRHFFR